MHTQTRGHSPVLTSAVFLIGRGVQVFGLTLAASFLHSNALSILMYTFCVAALSGGFLATTQRAWRTMRAINRKHFVPLVINSALIITAFITFSFGLKNAGAIRTVMMESYTHVLIYLPALFCGWSTLKSNKSKQRGVIAMVIAFVLLVGTAQITGDQTNFGSLSSSSLDSSIGRKLLMAPDPIVSNTNSSNANPAIPAVPAVPAAAAASSDEEEDTQRVGVGIASIVGNKPASISERLKARRTSPVTHEAISSNSDESNAEQIQKEDLEPAAQDANQMDPTLSPEEEEKLKQQQQQVQQAIDAMTKGVPPSSDFDFFFFRLSAPIIGLFSLLLSLFITQLQQKYEKSHAKEFEGKKRLHAMSLLMGCVLLVVPIAFQSVVFTSTPSELSFFTTCITLIIITLFTSILQFYLDVFEQKIEMNVMVKMNFIASFLFASFFDIVRSDDRLTWSTAVAAIIIFYGLHNLLQVMRRDGSTPGSPSTPSIIPVYARSTPKSTSSSLSFRELRLVYKHVMADRTTMKIFTFLCINFTFMFVEMIYGYWTNSLGLISDAGHMLFDCTALAIGLYASYVSKIKANGQYTYGYARYEILSGYVNGVFLLFIGYFVFVESIERLFEAPEIHSENLAVVAALGFGVNLIGLFFFHDHSHGHSHGGDGHGHSHGGHGGHGGHGDATAAAQANANTYGIYLHIAADTLGSVGVIISSLLVDNLGWTSADAICSIVISVLIILSVWPLIKQTAQVLLQRTPVFKAQPLRQALAQILTIDGVISYRHPHFWQFTEAELVGTVHVQVKEDADGQRILNAVTEILKDSHGPGVNNLTIQIEKEEFLQHLDPSVRLQFHMSGGNL